MKDSIYGNQEEIKSGKALAANAASIPAFNPAEFREYVDDFDITEEQKTELLKCLWSIAVTCVELGWGVDPVQLAIPQLAEFSSQEDFSALTRNQHVQQFSEVAKAEVAKEE